MSMVVRTRVSKPNGQLLPVTVLCSFGPFTQLAEVARQGVHPSILERIAGELLRRMETNSKPDGFRRRFYEHS